MSEIKYLIVIHNQLLDNFRNEYFTTKEDYEKRVREIEHHFKKLEIKRRFKVEEYEKEKWKY